jgi:predicted membrane-bound spermidine synthase
VTAQGRIRTIRSMTSSERIKVGFETSTGGDQFITSVNAYNDGQWHYAVVTNDGSNLRLYIDGTLITTKSTSGHHLNLLEQNQSE